MKKSIWIVILLLCSCSDNNSEKKFRKEVDSIKKELIPKIDVTATFYSIDTIGQLKFVSEIRSRLNHGVQSIVIKTQYLKDTIVLAEINNGPFESTYFAGQKINTNQRGEVYLYYLLKTKQNSYMVFQIKPEVSNLVLTKIDSTDKAWSTLKESMTNN